jgi:hypothetical protein
MMGLERDCDKGMRFNTHFLVIEKIWRGLNLLLIFFHLVVLNNEGSAANGNGLGDDVSVISPFSVHIPGVGSNEACACSCIISRFRSNSKCAKLSSKGFLRLGSLKVLACSRNLSKFRSSPS